MTTTPFAHIPLSCLHHTHVHTHAIDNPHARVGVVPPQGHG